MSKYLHQEFINIPFLNNELVYDEHNIQLYTNDRLKSYFQDTLLSIETNENFRINIIRLIKLNKLIPCWTKKNILNFITSKFYDNNSARHMLGMYTNNNKCIYIISDRLFNILSITKPKRLLKILNHELTHAISCSKHLNFIKIFLPYLTKYYYNMYCNLFNIKNIPYEIIKDDIEKLIYFLHSTFENTLMISQQKIDLYIDILNETFSKYSNDKTNFELLLKLLKSLIVKYYKDTNLLISFLDAHEEIAYPFYYSYYKTFGINNMNAKCFQELLIVSEVIAMCSEYSNNVKNIIYDNLKYL